MWQRRRKWRPTLGMLMSGLAGATLATLIAIAPEFTGEMDRRELASDMQEQFRRHGLPYAVAVAGAEHTILRVESPSMTKSFAEYLALGPSKAEYLGGVGFTAIVFANDKGANWTYDISKRRFQ
jgi:hypothetical protein